MTPFAHTQINQDYDSPWKDILETYFRQFLAFFFPIIEKDLDWEKGYEFLDKEFQSIAKEVEIGRRYLDKLIRVWRKDDLETWLLIHIEVQGASEIAFPERMYVYNYIDWVMSLPQRLSRRFWDNLISFEEEYKMPYVTSVEKIGIEKGMQQGMQQGMLLEAQDMLMEVLTERFGSVSDELSEQIKRIDSRKRLKNLIRQALRVKSFDEFGEKVAGN
ncbi:hypothetical protein M1N65_00885 [Thermodesulfovibrionales bacterium]|nr:hypothetical protein [Thermodesulfovibrionales bacterium]